MKTNALLMGGLMVVLLAGLPACKKKAAPPPPPPAEKPKEQAVVEFVGVETPEEQVLLKDLLRVEGVLNRGAEYVVVINQQVAKVGESFKLSANQKDYTLRILSITDQKIVLKAMPQKAKPAAEPKPTAEPASTEKGDEG